MLFCLGRPLVQEREAEALVQKLETLLGLHLILEDPALVEGCPAAMIFQRCDKERTHTEPLVTTDRKSCGFLESNLRHRRQRIGIVEPRRTALTSWYDRKYGLKAMLSPFYTNAIWNSFFPATSTMPAAHYQHNQDRNPKALLHPVFK